MNLRADIVEEPPAVQAELSNLALVTYNPVHHWFYFPEMCMEEASLLKCFVSKTDGRARLAPHSAFVDSTIPPHALPRQSIELRTSIFHPD